VSSWLLDFPAADTGESGVPCFLTREDHRGHPRVPGCRSAATRGVQPRGHPGTGGTGGTAAELRPGWTACMRRARKRPLRGAASSGDHSPVRSTTSKAATGSTSAS
jgi:hypothetical protein